LTFSDVAVQYWDDYDPVCWPLPFRINCIGCMGCGAVHDPPLTPDKRKGPYQVFFHPKFVEQLEDLIGKQETFDMIWDLQKKQKTREEVTG